MDIQAIRPISQDNMVDVSSSSASSASPLPQAEKNSAVKNTNTHTNGVQQQENQNLSPAQARELAEEMNDLMDDLQTSLGFFVHEKLDHQVVVEIKNRETNELIRQIPTEELLAIKEKMEEFRGLILDQSV